MSDATESELVAASRRGEREAFAELVRRCASMVDAVAYAATRDRSLSDDIAQDTFVAAWRDLDRLRDPAALRPWLCKIARNLAHKARRRRAREEPAVDIASSHTPYDAMREREVEQLVDAALAHVPAPYRETLVLFYYEQQSARAVAAALGIREDVVHQRLSRGRRHLAAALERQVQTTLSRRRSRRDLAVCVLAAIAVIPRSARATTTRGVSMLKLGTAFVAATTLAITTVATWPTADAAPRKPAPRATHRAAAKPPAARPPSLAASGSRAAESSSCTPVVRHVVDLALVGFEGATEYHAAGIRRVTQELEERCRRAPWSQREIACMMRAEYAGETAKCRPAQREPVDGPPAPVDADVDISCKSVGTHMGDLMIESTSLDDLGNVAGNILEDFSELPAQAVEACMRDSWSEDLRRCYAASDRYAQTVACNLRWR